MDHDGAGQGGWGGGGAFAEDFVGPSGSSGRPTAPRDPRPARQCDAGKPPSFLFPSVRAAGHVRDGRSAAPLGLAGGAFEPPSASPARNRKCIMRSGPVRVSRCVFCLGRKLATY
jgi:hypothetical protein